MRVKLLLLGLLLVASSAVAQEAAVLSTMSSGEAQRYLTVYNGPQSRLAGWVWTDKYTYSPGQLITLRITLKTNNDLYPYVVIAYRQNNQTGTKTYLPGNSSAVTDINGNTQAQGFQPTQLTSVTKQTVATLAAPSELGMHTFVYQLRDYTGTRVLKTMYMKFGVVGSVQLLQGDITTDTTLTNDKQWNLSGRVNVKNGATLTIEPGTFIIGQPGTQPPSVLVITTTGKINASGTRSRPIILTSSLPFGQRTRGDWGGLILLGKSQLNVGAGLVGNNQAGTSFIEGLVADPDLQYGGGTTPDLTHDCGTLRYVRVEYAGVILAPNSEVNSFTWGACGSDTVAEYLQSSYGLDDTFEWFGGNANARYLVGNLGNDDFLDCQLGYTGKIQFGLMFQSPDVKGNKGIECDNSEYSAAATPFSDPQIYNVTFVGSAQAGSDESNSPGVHLRRGVRGTYNNLVVTNFFSAGLLIDGSATQAEADQGRLKMDGILLWNNNLANHGGPTIDGQITDAYARDFAKGLKGNGAGKNFIFGADPLLNNPFEFSDPDLMGRFGSPLFRAGFVAPPDDGFFDQSVNFIGGIGSVNWTEEWTSFLVETDIAP